MMTIDEKIRDGKLQDHISIEAAKISALLSGKIDKYEYLTCEEYYLLIKVGFQQKPRLFILLEDKSS